MLPVIDPHLWGYTYCQTSNISHIIVGNKLVDLLVFEFGLPYTKGLTVIKMLANWDQNKMAKFCRQDFQMHFLKKYSVYFDSSFTEVCPGGSYIKWISNSCQGEITWSFPHAGKLKIFGSHPNWVVSYIAYTKFHSPRPVFHSLAKFSLALAIGHHIVSQRRYDTIRIYKLPIHDTYR